MRISTTALAAALGLGAATLMLAGPALAQAPDAVRIAAILEPNTLDPTAGAAEAIDVVVYQNIFEGLTRISETGAVEPALASAWTVSEDGLTYTFTLAEDVIFHDGTSFDAEDVVFTFERIRAPESINAQKALYAGIESVTAIDPVTVEIRLQAPSGQFLFDIGRGDAVIVAPESAENNGTTPIGTGPFAFVEWRRGAEVVLERFGNYWGEAPALARATYLFIPDIAARVNALLAGTVDGTYNMGTQTLPVFLNNPRFKVLEGTTEGETILAINNAKPPFNDLRVRQALNHAIDRQAVIDGASGGYGTPIGSHFAPHHPYYVDLTGTYPYDPDKARALLAEAGFPDGLDATLKLPPVDYARNGGQIIASQLAEVGVRVEQINVEFPVWLEDVFTNKDFDLTIISHVEPFDIGIYANPDYYFGFDDAEFRGIMARLNRAVDDADRRALAEDAQRRLAQEAVNVFLYELPQIGVWDARLEGQWTNAPIEGVVLRNMRWAR
ncbi:MAG: ABC transporter substrate-binding protein [Devosia sp.]